MTKRHAEQSVFHDAPFKRACCRPLYKIDTQLQSMDSAGYVNPPSLHALLGRRSKKRPHYFEDLEEEQEILKPRQLPACSHRDSATTENVLVNNSGSFRGISSPANSLYLTSKKRAREDTTTNFEAPKIEKHNEDADDDNDLCTFNSFQYWRVPLPEVDLSLVQIKNISGPIGDPTVKDLSSDAMEL